VVMTFTTFCCSPESGCWAIPGYALAKMVNARAAIAWVMHVRRVKKSPKWRTTLTILRGFRMEGLRCEPFAVL
jgi:hypothetical protein